MYNKYRKNPNLLGKSQVFLGRAWKVCYRLLEGIYHRKLQRASAVGSYSQKR